MKKLVKRTVRGSSVSAAQARRALFVEAYVTNGENATQAAIAAGFSTRRAGQTGAELVKEREVSAQIKARLGNALKDAALTTDRTLLEVRRLMTFDPRKLFNLDGTMKRVVDLDDDTAACISSVELEVDKDGRKVIGQTLKVKAWDKNSALEKAMKYHGMFEKDNKQRPPAEPLKVVWVEAPKADGRPSPG